MKKLLLFLTFTLITASATPAQESAPTSPAEDFAQAPFDVSQVFEWWDDGIITPAEADEIFSKLEEENYSEACLLAEVYAQEPCATKQEARQSKPPHSPSVIPHGRISWKGRYDSDGHLKSHRAELQLQFYYFKLHLGSQELLTYRRDGFEAHFGQVSTSEFHSHIPVDTLWGTALLYPIGKFKLGTFLDSARTFNAQMAFQANRSNEIRATFWKFPDAGALAVQLRTMLGQISTWYQFGQDCPLVKIQLQSEQTHLSWKTTAYIHGDSIPQGLNLSKGIVENRFWASQTVNAKWPTYNTSLSFKARILSPVATDSISARFKLSIESGPERLRPSLSVTCREASDNCSNTEWKSIITSAWEPFSFNASLLLRHNHHFKPPRIEFGAAYRTKSAFARLALSLPETSPAKAISVQNEIKFDGETLGCNFVFAFKKTKTKPFKPNFAHIQFFLKK